MSIGSRGRQPLGSISFRNPFIGLAPPQPPQEGVLVNPSARQVANMTGLLKKSLPLLWPCYCLVIGTFYKPLAANERRHCSRASAASGAAPHPSAAHEHYLEDCHRSLGEHEPQTFRRHQTSAAAGAYAAAAHGFQIYITPSRTRRSGAPPLLAVRCSRATLSGQSAAPSTAGPRAAPPRQSSTTPP